MIKSKIRKIFANEKVLEEYCLKIYEIERYFYEYMKKKKKLMEMIIVIYCLQLMFIFLNTF